MKKYILLIGLWALAGTASAQFAAVVSDPGSLAQRTALFMQQLQEQLQDRYHLVSQTQNTATLLKNAQEGIQKLQKVSHYVQSAQISIEILQEGAAVAKQIETIKKDFRQLHQLTDEERYNAVCFLLAVADEVTHKVEEGTKMTRSRSNNGEMTDYERIQLLKGIHTEIKFLRKELSAVHSRFKAKNSGALFNEHLQCITQEALFFTMDKAWGTEPVPGYQPASPLHKKSKKKSKKS